jgi:hypothetical protein
MTVIKAANKEDKILFARNKWLLAHHDSPEAKGCAFIGLIEKTLI